MIPPPAADPDRPTGAAALARQVPPPGLNHSTGLVANAQQAIEEQTERRLDEIEMIGEEEAAGFRPAGGSGVSAGMRYLHCSRTIHQLITDRNRAVALYLAVGSLLITASSSLVNANAPADLIVPLAAIKRWAFPVTFGTLAVLALFTAFLLIRTRIGLIYEVAKMNVLLGLPVGRVQRVNPLSIFFILHAVVSLAGGGNATLFVYHLLVLFRPGAGDNLPWAVAAGVAITVALVLLYVVTVLQTTAERKLDRGARG